jgi:kynurenine 3-monooxygenase
MIKSDRFDFEFRQNYLAHSYKELSIPPTAEGGWKINKNALHIWPRKSFMLIALPNLDGSFTCTLFLAYHGEVSFDKLKTKEAVLAFFKTYFPDVVPLMPNLADEFFENPTPALATIKLGPWFIPNKCAVVGDAAHPIVPFYGQGMNAGFEDCTYLNMLINEHGENWEHIFPEYYKLRKPNGDAVGDLALMNFIEMRDLVADPVFILKNKIDKKLAQLFPDQWVTQYAMVTFSDTPYSEAMRLGLEHQDILQKIVTAEKDIEKQLESDALKTILSKYIL